MTNIHSISLYGPFYDPLDFKTNLIRLIAPLRTDSSITYNQQIERYDNTHSDSIDDIDIASIRSPSYKTSNLTYSIEVQRDELSPKEEIVNDFNTQQQSLLSTRALPQQDDSNPIRYSELIESNHQSRSNSFNLSISENTLGNSPIVQHFSSDNLYNSSFINTPNEQTAQDIFQVQSEPNPILTADKLDGLRQSIDLQHYSHKNTEIYPNWHQQDSIGLQQLFNRTNQTINTSIKNNLIHNIDTISSNINKNLVDQEAVNLPDFNQINSDNMVNPIHLIESSKDIDSNNTMSTEYTRSSHKLHDSHKASAKVMPNRYPNEKKVGHSDRAMQSNPLDRSKVTALSKDADGNKINDESSKRSSNQQAREPERMVKRTRAPMYSSPGSPETKRKDELQAAIQKAKMLKAKRSLPTESELKARSTGHSKNMESLASSPSTNLSGSQRSKEEGNTANFQSKLHSEPNQSLNDQSTDAIDQSRSIGLSIATDLQNTQSQNDDRLDDIDPSLTNKNSEKPNVADLFSLSNKKNIDRQLLTSPSPRLDGIDDATGNDQIIHRYSPISPNKETKLSAMHSRYRSLDTSASEEYDRNYPTSPNRKSPSDPIAPRPRAPLKRAQTLQDHYDPSLNQNTDKSPITTPSTYEAALPNRNIQPTLPAYYNNINSASSASKSDPVCDYCCSKIIGTHNCLTIENHIMHRHCFRCFTCGRHLSRISYVYDEAEDRFYCQRCGRANSMTNLNKATSTKINPYAGTAPSTPSTSHFDRATKYRIRTMSNSLTDVSRRRTKDIARSLENILRSSTRSLNSMGGKNYGSKESLASNIDKNAKQALGHASDDDTSENDSVYTGIDNESEAGDVQRRIANPPPARIQLPSEGENQSLHFIDITMNDITMLYVKQARLEAQRNRLEKELYEAGGDQYKIGVKERLILLKDEELNIVKREASLLLLVVERREEYILKKLMQLDKKETRSEDDTNDYRGYIRELKAINERRGRIMTQVNEQGHNNFKYRNEINNRLQAAAPRRMSLIPQKRRISKPKCAQQ
ncbi:hypothetical protein TrispH2_002360 [Trichoplax sp. H2]|nr:hypothetical protein TrispH2_002360 [Trichoplax sp. H2]|eukprot:RDD45302.1 hypothetical protein TrispH2_002360 [Trichoplax sp. H2]